MRPSYVVDELSYGEWLSLGVDDRMTYGEWQHLKMLFPNIQPSDIPNLDHNPHKVIHWAPSRNFRELHARCGFETKLNPDICVTDIYLDLEEDVTCPVCLFRTYMSWIHGHERRDGSWRIGFLNDPESVGHKTYQKFLAQVARFFNQQRQASMAWDCIVTQAATRLLSTPQHHESPVDTVPDEASTWDDLCQRLGPA